MEEFYDLEPLEILDDELKDTSINQNSDIKIFRDQSGSLVEQYKDADVPFLLLDKKLRLIWENNSFLSHIGRDIKNTGNYFTNIFYNFRDTKKVKEIFDSIINKGNNFTWKGRVEVRDPNYLNIIANCIILPVSDDRGAPESFFAIFDDVTRENRNLLRKTFLSLLEASKLKDNDTGKHIQRVGGYSRLISSYLFKLNLYPEIDTEFVDNIEFLAPMHDVGKIGTPDDILNKAGTLEDWEWKIMKEHTLNGAYILSTYPDPMAKQIALFHHEKWNGEGYPYELSETDIPLAARIVTVADVYDALRMKRSYKTAYTHKETCIFLNEKKGSHFDPDLIGIFNQLESKFEQIYTQLID